MGKQSPPPSPPPRPTLVAVAPTRFVPSPSGLPPCAPLRNQRQQRRELARRAQLNSLRRYIQSLQTKVKTLEADNARLRKDQAAAFEALTGVTPEGALEEALARVSASGETSPGRVGGRAEEGGPKGG
jgi:hypothetical protein